MKKLILTLIGICTIPGFARADLLYTFDLTAADNSGVQPFTISFTAPTFVTVGESPAFTPFTITRGVDNWVMTQDIAGFSGPSSIGCFSFVTATNAGAAVDCATNSNYGNSGHVAVFQIDTLGGLPTTTGTTNVAGGGVFYSPSDPNGPEYAFDGTLSITTVATAAPEPASIALFGAALVTLSWKLRRRGRQLDQSISQARETPAGTSSILSTPNRNVLFSDK